MTKGEMIQRLEQLLQRVRVRTAEPRSVARHDASASGAQASPAHGVTSEITSVGQLSPAAQAVIAAQRKDHDSQERLLASQLEPPEEPTVVVAATAHDSIPPIEVTEVEVVEEEEEEEEAPVSSRRSVLSQPEERLAEMAFGREEEPAQPLHTPPPESGRLPAAAPAADYDADITGVRSAAPSATQRPEEPRRELIAEAVRPSRAPNDSVAEIIAAAQSFAPGTFVALLDASLSL